MTERRYDEEETRRIFDEASREGAAQSGSEISSAPGFTLAELQQIGAEAGLDPDRIASAAIGLDARSSATVATRRMVGLPIGVSRVVDLPDFDDSSWNRLVVDLRRTFEARGRVRVEAAFREWRNGNLRAIVEPTDRGYRLRLGTLKGSVYQSLTFAGMSALVGSVLFVAGVIGQTPFEGWPIAALMAVVGAASAGFSALRLPEWARTREQQMEGVAERAFRRALAPSSES